MGLTTWGKVRVIIPPDVGDVLQRWDYKREGWRDARLDRKLVAYPFDYETLSPGRHNDETSRSEWL